MWYRSVEKVKRGCLFFFVYKYYFPNASKTGVQIIIIIIINQIRYHCYITLLLINQNMGIVSKPWHDERSVHMVFDNYIIIYHNFGNIACARGRLAGYNRPRSVTENRWPKSGKKSEDYRNGTRRRWIKQMFL